MSEIENNEVRNRVRDDYATIAIAGESGCGCAPGGCDDTTDSTAVAEALGYTKEELESLPEGANLGLGCGNPTLLASLKKGETVLDLGSGAGIDIILSARKVGSTGSAIGVDMTPDMITKARKNIAESGLDNVSVRLGEIEHLPVADSVVDVIMSNCVINLSPDKQQVFNEAYRVLKPGGRIAVSDIVRLKDFTDEMKADATLHSACITGASTVNEVEELLLKAGFSDIDVELVSGFDTAGDEVKKNFVSSANISAIRPGGGSCCC
jgi:SAM-dependent methyltransferase